MIESSAAAILSLAVVLLAVSVDTVEPLLFPVPDPFKTVTDLNQNVSSIKQIVSDNLPGVYKYETIHREIVFVSKISIFQAIVRTIFLLRRLEASASHRPRRALLPDFPSTTHAKRDTI